MIPFILKTAASSVLPFMGKYWKPIALVILIAGLALYRSYLIGEIEDRDVQIVALKEEKLDLTAAIQQQNAEIDKWVNIGRAEKLKYQNLQNTLNAMKQAHEKELNVILKEKKPETCEEAIQYLIEGKDDLQWEKQ